MKRFLLFLWFPILSVGFAPLAGAGDWFRYKSDNFTVYSDASQSEVEEMIQNTERFRVAALRFTGIGDFKENERLRIFYFDDSNFFQRFGKKRNVSGFFYSTIDGPVIFARDVGNNAEVSELMFHEYTHHLMRERSMLRYPRWYSEGFAELLSSAEVRKDYVRIGNVPIRIRYSWSVPGFRPLDIVQLLEPEDRSDPLYQNNFYATSWLLTHYLQMGKYAGNPDYLRNTREYLNAVSRGENPVEGFSKYFGRTLEEMQKELRRYRKDDVYAFRYKVSPYTNGIERSSLSDDDVASLLVEQAFARGKEDLARELITELGSVEDLPLNLKVQSAILSGHQEDFSVAHQLFDDIEADEWMGAETAELLSHLHLDLLGVEVEKGGWSDEHYRSAIQYAKLSIDEDPGYLSGYRWLWEAYKLAGEHLSAVQTMMAAYEHSPRSLSLNREIGFYVAELRQIDLAKPYLEIVSVWSHSEEDRDRANEYLRQLIGQEDTADESETDKG
ncbi:hypothetical protein [Microbulbifer sp. Q7]|uniref:hypothetical protein n=1 Tax=Microbulbifer sp. Q7 TaxID=1785091 RepID=UPI00082A6C0D|nr:hypothetical protein [Microbulbifer sp. Q7]